MAPLSESAFPGTAALIVLIVILAGLIPAVFVTMNGENGQTIHYNVSDTNHVRGDLAATLKNKTETTYNLTQENDTEMTFLTEKQINATLLNAATGNTTTLYLINETQSQNATINGETIQVTYVDNVALNEALIRFTYPASYGFTSIQTLFIGSVGMIVTIFFLYLIFLLIDGGDSI